MVFNGTCCNLYQIPQTPKKTLFVLSEPMRKHVWIDSSFSEEEKDDIIRAYKTVECSTNYSLVTFEFTNNASLGDTYLMRANPSIVVINTTSDDPRIKASDKDITKNHPNKRTAGLYLTQEQVPTVLLPRDRLNRSDFYQIAAHEAIHSSLNILSHSSSTNSIMFYATDETSAKDLTDDDLEFICELYFCMPSSFKVCEGK